MSLITFNYNENLIRIQCDKNNQMGDIFKKFYLKADIRRDKCYFIYLGKLVNEYLTLEELAKDDKKITILAFDIDDDDDEEKIFGENINKITVKIKYSDKKSEIICEPEEKMGDILQKFCITRAIDKNSIYLWYNKRTIVQNV